MAPIGNPLSLETVSLLVQIIDGIPVFGDPVDQGAVDQMKACLQSAEKVALMADHHLGYSMAIGGVAAYKDAISPSGVGYDIGCGNKAVRLDVPAQYVRDNVETLADQIFERLSFGVGRKNDEAPDHVLFYDPIWQESEFLKSDKIYDLAREQLGTIGAGNHWTNIFFDEQDRVWIGNHFGSRGLGHKTATYFLKSAGAKDGIHADPCVLSLSDDIGKDYWRHMELAGRYAYAGRDWVCDRVASILGGSILEEVHANHNLGWCENHEGEEFIVVRKGATPAFPGQRGLVGGSMGDDSVIVEGIESDLARYTLHSTVHGAGRVMSRTRAAGKSRWKNGRKVRVSEGEITQKMMNDWVSAKNVTLRGGGTDESPHVYKRLDEVLAHHDDTIRIVHRLRPVIVCMASASEFDPYKD